jgi:hypothetical protein
MSLLSYSSLQNPAGELDPYPNRTQRFGLISLAEMAAPSGQNRRMKKMTCNEGTTHISCTGLGATLSVYRWNVTKGSPVHRMMGTRTACSHG